MCVEIIIQENNMQELTLEQALIKIKELEEALAKKTEEAKELLILWSTVVRQPMPKAKK